MKAPCAFDELNGFNTVTSFTPDCMHDIFDCVAKKGNVAYFSSFHPDMKVFRSGTATQHGKGIQLKVRDGNLVSTTSFAGIRLY